MPIRYPTFEAFRNALNYLAQRKFEEEQRQREQEFQWGLVQFREEKAGERAKAQREASAAQSAAELDWQKQKHWREQRTGKIEAEKERQTRIDVANIYASRQAAGRSALDPMTRIMENRRTLHDTITNLWTNYQTARTGAEKTAILKQIKAAQADLLATENALRDKFGKYMPPSEPSASERWPAPEGAIPAPEMPFYLPGAQSILPPMPDTTAATPQPGMPRPSGWQYDIMNYLQPAGALKLYGKLFGKKSDLEWWEK
jgi:hypothetical protein